MTKYEKEPFLQIVPKRKTKKNLEMAKIAQAVFEENFDVEGYKKVYEAAIMDELLYGIIWPKEKIQAELLKLIKVAPDTRKEG